MRKRRPPTKFSGVTVVFKTRAEHEAELDMTDAIGPLPGGSVAYGEMLPPLRHTAEAIAIIAVREGVVQTSGPTPWVCLPAGAHVRVDGRRPERAEIYRAKAAKIPAGFILIAASEQGGVSAERFVVDDKRRIVEEKLVDVSTLKPHHFASFEAAEAFLARCLNGQQPYQSGLWWESPDRYKKSGL